MGLHSCELCTHPVKGTARGHACLQLVGSTTGGGKEGGLRAQSESRASGVPRHVGSLLPLPPCAPAPQGFAGRDLSVAGAPGFMLDDAYHALLAGWMRNAANPCARLLALAEMRTWGMQPILTRRDPPTLNPPRSTCPSIPMLAPQQGMRPPRHAHLHAPPPSNAHPLAGRLAQP